jgi:hypothetical protein
MDNLSIEDGLLLIDRLSEKNASLLSDIDIVALPKDVFANSTVFDPIFNLFYAYRR